MFARGGTMKSIHTVRAGLCILAICGSAPAAITQSGSVTNNKFGFNANYKWTFEDGMEDDAILSGAWSVLVISDTSGQNPLQKTLRAAVEHQQPPHAGEGVCPEISPALSGIKRPAAGTIKGVKVAQAAHAQHFDTVRLSYQL